MAQTTSVNGNASLALYRENLPSGAITIQLRVKVASWSGGNAQQVIFRVEGDTGQLLVYAERDTGNVVLNSGAFTNLSTGSYADFATLSLTWTGASGASAITVRWTPDGGSTTTATTASRGNLWGLYVLGLFWDSGTICNQVRICSLLVDNRLYSAAEITAQSLDDAALEAVNAFYPMDAAGTVEQDASGNNNDLIVGAGAGATVSDSPYPADAHEFGGTGVEAASETGTGALGYTADIGTPLSAAVWMTTGHSLTDALDGYVADLADAAGFDQDWQRQYIIGSPLRVRTSGGAAPGEPWAGYLDGANRSGSDLDLIAHFRNVTATGGKVTAAPYTHVIIAERHDIYSTLSWEWTIPLARHYYELVREGSPSAVGYLYATWLEYANATLPEWIQHLRDAQSATAAIASRINLSLAYESRSDRVQCIPSSLALANALAASTGGNTLAGITAGSDAATVDVLFSDEVHPTAVGWYLLGLVTYGTLYRRDPRGLAYPVTVTEEQAESLQAIAWETLADYFDEQPLGEQYDQAGLKSAFVDYLAIALQIRDDSDQLAGLTAHYSGTSSDLHFDAEDEALWFDAPEGGGADHELAGVGVECSSETGSAALTVRHAFAGTSVEAAAETGSAALGTSVAFTGTGAEAAAETGTPTLAHCHVFGSLGIEAASEVGTGALPGTPEFFLAPPVRCVRAGRESRTLSVTR
jgi:hypothetical protein